jgi:hypothetical protein
MNGGALLCSIQLSNSIYVGDLDFYNRFIYSKPFQATTEQLGIAKKMSDENKLSSEELIAPLSSSVPVTSGSIPAPEIERETPLLLRLESLECQEEPNPLSTRADLIEHGSPYASSGGVKSSNYRQSWAATVRNVVAKKWPSLRRKACIKVSPIKRNTTFLICKRAISMIKHPVKHPQKGHFSNVGLLRFLSRVQKCIRFGYNT